MLKCLSVFIEQLHRKLFREVRECFQDVGGDDAQFSGHGPFLPSVKPFDDNMFLPPWFSMPMSKVALL